MQSGDTNGESPGVVTGKATESVSKWRYHLPTNLT